MNQPLNRIEDEILRVLLSLVARRRRSEEEIEFDQSVITQDLRNALHTATESDTDTREQAGQELVPVSLLQLVLKPDLPAEVLEMIAKLLNNDPKARQALVKLLSASSTSSSLRKALTAVLAKCAEHGYSNALDVLREALAKSNSPEVHKQLMETIEDTSRYTLDYLRPNPLRIPTPSPWLR